MRPKKGIGLGRSPIDWVGDYIGTNEHTITREKSYLLGLIYIHPNNEYLLGYQHLEQVWYPTHPNNGYVLGYQHLEQVWYPTHPNNGYLLGYQH